MSYGLSIWMLLLALLSGVAAAALLYVANKKQHYGKALTIILFGLRTLLVGMVVLLLFNPYVRQQFSAVEPPIVVLAHDNSSSIILGKDSAYYRTDYPKQFADFEASVAADFQVDSYLFGQEVRDFSALDFTDQLTDVSSLLKRIERRYYKRNVGALVLLSDGIYNRGFDPELLAAKFPFPIYTVVVGDTIARPDLAIREVHYNRQVAFESTFPVRVTVSAHDLANRKATLRLSRDGDVIGEQEFEILSNRFSKEIDFMFEADTKGVKQIDIQLSGIAEEEQLLNNVKHIFIEVLDQKYKVLCLANAPHPDLAALRSVLNENYEVDFAFAKDVVPDFGAYDLLVLHQMPSSGANFEAVRQQLETHAKLPVFFIVGQATDLDLLGDLQDAYVIKPGATNTVLDVKAHLNASFSTFIVDAEYGEMLGSYPPLAMPHVELSPSKSHDDLLLQNVMGRKSGLPLLSFARGDRKMAFLFGVNLWRWRLFEYYQSKNHTVFDAIFSKSLKYLLLSSDDGSSVYCKEEFFANEPVVMTAELRNLANELVTEPELKAQLTNKLTGDTYEFVFAKRDHDYELDAGALPEGLYTYKVEALLGDRRVTASGSFSVVALGIEAQQLTADAGRLRNLAHLTNGKCYSAYDLQQLAVDLRADTRITSVEHHESRYQDLIHSRWIWLVLIGWATAEWVLRKMFGSY